MYVRVWLHQGFHVNLTSLHGYGLCCGMSDPNQPDNVTSGSNVSNPPDTGHPQTWQQSAANDMADAAAAAAAARAAATPAPAAATPAPAASQGVQSVTLTIDYNFLATAVSRLNDDSASNLERCCRSKLHSAQMRTLLTSSTK